MRGRKKSDLSTPLLNYNSTSFNSEISIGGSPPRGTDDTAESDSSSVASSLEKLQDDFSMFPELWYVICKHSSFYKIQLKRYVYHESII